MFNRLEVHRGSIGLLILIAGLLMPGRQDASADTTPPALRAGAAKVNITPGYPAILDGYGGRTELSGGVHDEIFVRALVFESGGETAAIISAEILMIGDKFWNEVTDRLQQRYRIPKQNVLLCATHTHAAPAINERYHFGPREAEHESTQHFTRDMANWIDEAVGAALQALTPVRIGYGCGEVFIGVNRRADTANNEVRLGHNPAGPVDRSLPVVRVNTLDGRTLAVLFEQSTHGTVTGARNYQISGDWCGAAMRYVEREIGRDAVALFVSGAAGDVNPFYRGGKSFKEEFIETEYVGNLCGEEVVRVTQQITRFCEGPVRAMQQDVMMPGKKYMTLDETIPDVLLKMSALKVGTIVFSGASGEILSEIGKAVKEQSPYRQTLFLSNCNGYTSYVPTDKEYPRGGYEVKATRIMRGGDAAIVNTLLHMMAQF